MYLNELEAIHLRHHELLRAAEEARLARMVTRKPAKAERPVVSKAVMKDEKRTTAELKRVPNTN